jgi:hypothetical protein
MRITSSLYGEIHKLQLMKKTGVAVSRRREPSWKPLLPETW